MESLQAHSEVLPLIMLYMALQPVAQGLVMQVILPLVVALISILYDWMEIFIISKPA